MDVQATVVVTAPDPGRRLQKKRTAAFLSALAVGCKTQRSVSPTRTIIVSNVHSALPPPPNAVFNTRLHKDGDARDF
jgi:hypothetical protein